jgi:uncharacterized protein (TIGR00730 family)
MSSSSVRQRPNRAVCVYCGSQHGSDPAFAAAARQLGADIVAKGYDLVYGGGGVGLMGDVARATIASGGYVTGIIPQFLKAREAHLDQVQDLIVTRDMHERKMLMFERADAFVALPGGIGTLEELFEQMTWAQIGQHTKPLVIANIAGFWDPLLALLSHLNGKAFVQQSFVPGNREARIHVAERAQDIVPLVTRLLQKAPEGQPSFDITGKF